MLVVIAQKEELKLVEELGYSNYPVLITGVGGMNAVRALKDLPKDTEILNIGYCGSNLYEIGTKVYITGVGTQHQDADFKEKLQALDLNGVDLYRETTTYCFSSTDFVTSTKIKNPCVFDMELAFICALGFRSVKSIKVVSDNLDKKQYDKNVNKE